MAEYIEREAVKEHLMSYAGMFTDELGFVVNLQAVLNGIDFQPAVDVVEVKRGHWEMSATYPLEYVCSCCGGLWLDFRSDYCPRCGAKMGGDTK